MYCKQCGSELDESVVNFCPSCGATLNKKTVIPPDNEDGSKFGKKAIMFIVAICLLFVAVVAYCIISDIMSDEIEKTQNAEIEQTEDTVEDNDTNKNQDFEQSDQTQMNVAETAIDPLEIAGYYGGSYGQSTAEINMSTDNIGAGHIVVYFDSEIEEYGGTTIEGTIVEESDNVYLLETVDGTKINLAYNYIEDNLSFEIWINGEQVEEFLMINHFQS